MYISITHLKYLKSNQIFKQIKYTCIIGYSNKKKAKPIFVNGVSSIKRTVYIIIIIRNWLNRRRMLVVRYQFNCGKTS